MVLNLDEVIELQKYLESKNAVKIHLHDACGGQYFTLDEPSQSTIDLIKKFLENKKIEARYSDKFDSFTIGGLHRG